VRTAILTPGTTTTTAITTTTNSVSTIVIILGPTKENQIRRIKTNEELDKLIKHKNNQSY